MSISLGLKRHFSSKKTSALKVAITGLPFSGKTTFFNNFVNFQKENLKNFQETNQNSLEIPIFDSRFLNLVSLFQPKREIPTTLQLTKISYKDNEEPFSKNYLAQIDPFDGFINVVNNFEKDFSIENSISDIEKLKNEISNKDLTNLENNFINFFKIEAKNFNNTIKKNYEKAYDKIINQLCEGIPLENLNEIEKTICEKFNLLSIKPKILAINISEPNYKDFSNEKYINLLEYSKKNNENIIFFYKNIKENIFFEEIIKKISEKIKLIQFFTVGSDEVRGWSLKQGATAAEAASKIHSDFQKGFLAALVVDYNTFKTNTEKVEKNVRMEDKVNRMFKKQGKEYIVKDGDIILFKAKLNKKK